MAKIENISSALKIFEEAAYAHGEASKLGKFKIGNRSFEEIVDAVTFMRDQGELDKLQLFFGHPEMNVRVWAAAYLLPTKTRDAEKVLEDASKGNDIVAFGAETTLQQWREGSLKMLFREK